VQAKPNADCSSFCYDPTPNRQKDLDYEQVSLEPSHREMKALSWIVLIIVDIGIARAHLLLGR
jgi:hypothetical protein